MLLHNLMVAGFNVVDIVALHRRRGLPVVAVAKGQPDLPEPLRLAHLVAAGWVLGQSRGS